MATNKKKRSASPVASMPVAALYQLNEGTERGDKVREVLASQGIRAKTITQDQLNNPVGAVVGMQGFKPSHQDFAGEVPQGEFMLLNNVSSKALDQLLAAMRQANVSVACKAQVTQFNKMWPIGVLIAQVLVEHEAMMQSENTSSPC